MVITFDDDPVPVGLAVTYHGSLTEAHGAYRVTGECECPRV